MTRLRMPPHATVLLSCLAAAVAAPALGQENAVVREPDDQAVEWGACPDFMPEGCEIAVLHGDPAEPDVDIFFRVPGGAEIPRHWHTSPERIVAVSGEMRVDYDGQEPVVLRPGSYGYGPAKAPHSATCLSDEACTLFIAFVDPLDAMAGGPD